MRNVIVMSGVSGSGKTTHALKLMAEYEEMRAITKRTDPIYDCRKVSADDHFYDLDGKYKFDPSQLSEAHGACFRNFINALRDSTELVIVDNTNTTAVEIAPYMLGAQAFAYEVRIVVMRLDDDNLKFSIAECAKRNKHGVSIYTINRQDFNMVQSNFPPHWQASVIPVVLGTTP